MKSQSFHVPIKLDCTINIIICNRIIMEKILNINTEHKLIVNPQVHFLEKGNNFCLL